MKRIIILALFAAALYPKAAVSQDMFDALRFSQNFYEGTARFSSMGGAFSALGGDFTTLSVNPAGLGVYRSSEFVFTPAVSYSSTKSSMPGSGKAFDSRTRFGISNLGYVAEVDTYKSSGLVGLSFAVGYNKLNNFNYNAMVDARNVGDANAYVNGLVNQANGRTDVTFDRLNSNDPFRSLGARDWNVVLGWDNFLLEYDDAASKFYRPDADISIIDPRQQQTAIIESEGSIGEYVFSFGGNVSHKLYFGMTLGVQDINYEMTMNYREVPNGRDTDLVNLIYRQRFETTGYGINIKGGLIFRPIPQLRLGAAVHTPTWQYLRDTYQASSTVTLRSEGVLDRRSLINDFDYRVNTPYKLVFGGALTLLNTALVSVDYEYVDYSTMRMREDRRDRGFGDTFWIENDMIKSTLRATNNLRAGAEIRLGQGLALRAGYAYYESPYRNNATSDPDIVSDSKGKLAASNYSMGLGDNSVMTYSAGIGYRFDGGFIDLGYSLTTSKATHIIDDYQYGVIDGVTTKNEFNRFIMTFGLRF